MATHLVWISRVPGFHFDEAWAANFAHRIAFEPGFWPLYAQSPYTSPWSHYLVAAAFRIFGVSLAVFRATGIAMVALGVAQLSAALAVFGHRRAASNLPWIVAASLPLILNHRFSIELTTFHVFCFGLFAWGTAFFWKGRTRLGGALAWCGFVLGVTSHLLFLSVGLALLAASVIRRSRLPEEARPWVILTTVSLLPFFCQVFRLVPERDKSSALLVCDVLILLWATLAGGRNPIPESSRRAADWILRAACAPFLLMLLFFAEGHWSVLQIHGGIAQPILFGLSFFCGAAAVVLNRHELGRRLPKEWITWACVLIFVTGCLMLKPAARYFEIPLLVLAILLSLVLEFPKWRSSMTLLGFFFVLGISQFISNYWSPGRDYSQREARIHFLIFKDESRDFLPKQQLAVALGARGCGIGSIKSEDGRVMEALRFLSFSDWKIDATKICPAKEIWVARRAQPPVEPGLKLLEVIGEFLVFTPDKGGSS